MSHHPIFELNTMKFRLIFGAFSETRMIMIYMQLVVSWILTGIQLVIAEKRNSSRSMLLLFVFIFKLEYFAVIIWNYVSSGVRWWWIWITGGNSNSPWGPIGLGVGILVILSSCPCDFFIRIEFFKVYTSAGDTSVYSVNVYTYYSG